MTFQCPQCHYETDQPSTVKWFSHRCPKNKGKLVVLKPVAPVR